MFSNNAQYSKEEESHVIGFHVRSNSSFIIVHSDKVEILEGISRDIIKLNLLSDGHTLTTQMAELPNNHVALVYIDSLYYEKKLSLLTILDLKDKKCVALKQISPVESLYALPDGSLLVNSEIVYDIQGEKIITTEDSRFKDFARQENSLGDKYFIPLLNNSGFIYYTFGDQSTVKIITNQFKEVARLQLGPHYNFNNISFMGLTPNKYSKIKYLTLVSQNYFACITRCEDKYLSGVRSSASETFRLHVVCNNLKEYYKVNLSSECFFPQAPIIVLKEEYIVVVGFNYHPYANIEIEIFNLKCQKINKFTIEQDIGDNFVAATPNGQLITCSRSGQIVMHTVIPSTENLRKKTESVLTAHPSLRIPKDLVSIVTSYAGFSISHLNEPKDKLEIDKLRLKTESVLMNSAQFPKALIPIVTNYAGFFSKNLNMPQDIFEEKKYPNYKVSWLSKFRSVF